MRVLLKNTKGHIPGAINVPVETPQLITEKIPDKNETIFVYCLSGGPSQRACELFADMGYGHITDIGGILFWPGNLEKGSRTMKVIIVGGVAGGASCSSTIETFR